MPSRDAPLTIKDIKRSFTESLKSAIELGQRPSKAANLSPRVYDAIESVATAYPQTDEVAIQKARKEFRDYLTWRAEMATRRK